MIRQRKYDGDFLVSELCQDRVEDLKFFIQKRIAVTAPKILSFIDPELWQRIRQPLCCAVTVTDLISGLMQKVLQ